MQPHDSTKISSLFFSFFDAFFSVFGFNEGRIERVRKIILSRTDEEALREDFNKIGGDIKTAMKKHDSKKELQELYLCE